MIENIESLLNDDMDRAYRIAMDKLEDEMGFVGVSIKANPEWVRYSGSVEEFIIFLSLYGADSKFVFFETIDRDGIFNLSGLGDCIGRDQGEHSDGHKVEAFSVFAMIGGVMVGANMASDFAHAAMGFRRAEYAGDIEGASLFAEVTGFPLSENFSGSGGNDSDGAEIHPFPKK